MQPPKPEDKCSVSPLSIQVSELAGTAGHKIYMAPPISEIFPKFLSIKEEIGRGKICIKVLSHTTLRFVFIDKVTAQLHVCHVYTLHLANHRVSGLDM